MKRALSTLSLLLLAAVAAFFSVWTCVVGAMLAGLEGGGWNWQFIPFIVLGGLSGVGLAILTLILAGTKLKESPELKIVAVIFGPPVCSFLIGVIAFPLLTVANEHNQARGRERYESEQARMQSYLAQVRQDPEIALRERWLDNWDERRRVLNDNMAAGAIQFTEEQLERMYKTWTYGQVFYHPACSSEFLSRYFGPSAARAEHINYTDLAAIVSNPNTPLGLVEQVAASKILPIGAVYPAQEALKKRSPQTPSP